MDQNNPNQYFQPQSGVPQPPQQPNSPYGGQSGLPPVSPQQQPQLGHNDAKHRKSIGWIITTAVLVLLLLGAGGFGIWAYAERQDYKNNSDQKVAAAVAEAEKRTTEENNARFAEEVKNPLKTFQGPSALGSVKLQYPKTWSGYIDQSGDSGEPLVAQFHPDVVPATSGGEGDRAIALTVEVLEQTYDQVVSNRDNDITSGDVKASPYALPKMKDQIGMRFQGKINQNFNGTEIVLPLRDKALVITTETDKYMKDFNKYILPNITFVP